MSTLQRVIGGAIAGFGEHFSNVAAEQRQMRGMQMRMAYERAMRKENRDWKTSEREATQDFSAGESAKDRDWRTGQAEADRSFQESEGQKNREARTTAAIGKQSAEDKKQALKEMERMATVTDEFGTTHFDHDLYQAMKKGHKKFGRVPSVGEARGYLESSNRPEKRRWPSETKISWKEIIAQARKRASKPGDVPEIAARIRDSLYEKGYGVPEGPAPIEPEEGGAKIERGRPEEAPPTERPPSGGKMTGAARPSPRKSLMPSRNKSPSGAGWFAPPNRGHGEWQSGRAPRR